MANVVATDIEFSIEPMLRNRSRQIGYGAESARIPFIVKVLSLTPATTDLDEIEDRILRAAVVHLADNPVHSLNYTGISDVETINDTYWRIVADFESRGAIAPSGVPDIEFNTTGGSLHIVNSIQTRFMFGAKKNAAYGGRIGYDKSTGEIAGVDIPIPAFNWGTRRTFDASMVTRRYIITLCYMTGRVNEDPFQGFEPGTTLFLGAMGRRVGGGDWDITYQFSSLPNSDLILDPETGQTLIDNRMIIPGLVESDGTASRVVKFGWDHVWCDYDDVDVLDGGGNVIGITKKPVAAYVEQVLPGGVFANLGLG
jgi:hypothetical protein